MKNSYEHHRYIWKALSDGNDTDGRQFIFSFNKERNEFIVLAAKKYCDSYSNSDVRVEMKEINDSFFSYNQYHFKLKVNIVKTIRVDEKRRKREALIKVDHVKTWLKNHEEKFGFSFSDIEIIDYNMIKYNKKGQKGMHIVQNIKGTIAVTNKEQFIKTFAQGIGKAKSFGYGMFELLPINNLGA